ncbi:MAG TPA: AbgT family transporter [Spirochaetales bacterium]|nr:AbgT family transporter [Spirochaetales bacterium]HPM72926.1 AbgT family transporter [Spirochaetales bacterium]
MSERQGARQTKASGGRGAGVISARSFVASLAVLAALMLAAGVLTRLVPAGSYERSAGADGALVVVPGSYVETARPDYPAWRWLTAPFEVLASEDAALAIVIIAFIAVVGGAFAAMREAGVLAESVRLLAERFKARRMALLAVLCLFFMAIGSFMGVFEEVVPLVPIAIALSLSFGWDVFAGLGMSILAVGFGFSSAVANPFSVGTAQRLAGVPMLSGSGFRLVVFACVYALYLTFMVGYVRRLERKGLGSTMDRADGSPVSASAYGSGSAGSPGSAGDTGRAGPDQGATSPAAPFVSRGVRFFGWSALVLAILVLLSSVTRVGADYVLPAIALGFLVIGVGAALAAGVRLGAVARSFGTGALGVLPAGLLILMALSVKRIVVAGGIMDTALYAASGLMERASGYGAAALMYGVVLVMNFFIGSASAKAFLLIPVLAPLADLTGLSRQLAVQAFVFGDGFSNMLYPTNAVLLISLGLAGMSWGAWFKKTWRLQLATLALTMGLLMVAVAIGYA